MTTSTPSETDVAAALLHKPQLLNGCRDLLAPALFREPVFREIIGLCLRGATDREDIESRLRASGQWTDERLDEELRGLEDMAMVLQRDHVLRAVEAMTSEHVVNRRLAERPTTEYGNAERLITRHGRDLRYVAPWRRWLTYTGLRWQPDQRDDVRRMMKQTIRRIYAEASMLDSDGDCKALGKWASRSESERVLRNSITLAQSEPGIPVLPDELDGDPWMLNVANGTIDLRTGTLRDHDAGDMITKLAPVEYDPDATSPTFERFIEETTCGSEHLAAYLQRYLGMCLTGDVTEQILLVWWGTGSNGKSTLLDLILRIMGDYAGLAAPELLVAKKWSQHPTELADLSGKRLVVASETERNQQLRTQFVKAVTGDTRLKGRFMRRDFFEFDRQFKIVLVTNNRPVVQEQSNAIWRRLKLVPFTNVVHEASQDKDLLEKLWQEAPGVLAWMVRGCLSWQRETLPTPQEVVTATADYKRESDWLEQFVKECLVFIDGAFVTTQRLNATFEQWCRENGVEANLADLRHRIRQAGCQPKESRQGRGWTNVNVFEATEPAT